jgi:hypothetical protein
MIKSKKNSQTNETKINASSGSNKRGQEALFILCTLAMAGCQLLKRIGVGYLKQRFRSLEKRCQADVHIPDVAGSSRSKER